HLLLKRGIKRRASRRSVLPGAHIKLADHAHLQVLWRGDVAMPEVSASIGCKVVISEGAADVDGDRSVRHTVIHRGSVGIPVEVDGVLLEQVRPHNHADVSKAEEQFVVLVESNERRRDIPVHHSDINNLAWIYVPIETWGLAGAIADRLQVGSQPHGPVVCEWRSGCPTRTHGVSR